MTVLFIFLFAATIVASIMGILNAHRADKLEDGMDRLEKEIVELRRELAGAIDRLWDKIEKES